MDWIAYKQHRYISQSLEARKLKIKVSAWLGEGPLPGSQSVSSRVVHMVEEARDLSGASFTDTNLIREGSIFLILSSLGIRISTHEFWGNTFRP